MNYEDQKIVNVDIEEKMKKSFIEYAMSVIVSRALPDVRDGLKPVHRRILYTMYEDGLVHNKPYRKCATAVGDVLGRYHPHGDASVYDALVRLAQDFSLRYPLVDGHGNFGSIDGDPPAAYRYTEARLSRMSAEMLTDIEKNTVDFKPNFDELHMEPTVLPSRFPNLLVNGSMGIAVGMATNIPPHNLGEVVDGIVEVIDNPEATLDDIMQHIKGPDFPTGGIIMGRSGMRAAYHTGRGRIKVRSHCDIEEGKDGRTRIIVREIPYMVNKARLVSSIADLVNNKTIEGIADLHDESSDRVGIKVVIKLKKDANPQVVLNQLYKHTQLEDTNSIIMIALVDGEPRVLNLREVIDHYIAFQKEVIRRRTEFDLKKAKERCHILEGLKIACDNIDEVIHIIRTSYDDAKQRLMERFQLSEVQAQAILDMRLGRLQGLEVDKIMAELAELHKLIDELEAILADEAKQIAIVRKELLELKEKFADERKTEISLIDDEIDIEDLIEEEECVFTMTQSGYIKRCPVSTYKAQRRGGRGITGMTTKEDDYVAEMFTASTHNYLLFFTSKGRMYKMKGYEVPEASRQAKGTNIVNLLQLEQDEKVTAMINVKEFDEGSFLVMATRNGTVKKTPLEEINSSRKGGIIVISLEEGDELIGVKKTDGTREVVIGSHNGKAIRFHENDVRPMGRVAHGVRGILLEDDDHLVGISLVRPHGSLLTITEKGYGKRTDLSEYKLQLRGGKGVTNYNITEKTGKVVGIKVVDENDDIILTSSNGIIIRFAAEDVSCFGRIAQGVILMRVAENETVVTLARTVKEEDEGEDGEQVVENGENPVENGGEAVDITEKPVE
jgi:DNA gyrase subunit A